MMHRIVSGLVLVVVVQANAWAESGGGRDRLVARQHFGRGVALYEAERYAQALAEFQAAYEAMPHPTVLVNIANCYGRTDRPVRAVNTFERYLRERGGDLSSEERRQVEAALQEQRGRLGRLTVEVPGPDGATVLLDGVPLGTAPLEHTEETAQGNHVVEVRAAGRPPTRLSRRLRGGGNTTIRVVPGAAAEPEVREQAAVPRADVVSRADLGLDDERPPSTDRGHVGGSSELSLSGSEGATVEIDGEIVGLTPWQGPVSPGEHDIHLYGAGYRAWGTTLDIEPNERTEVRIDLTGGRRPRWVPWVEWGLLGLGAALVLPGVIALGSGRGRYKDSEVMYQEIGQGNFADRPERELMWARYDEMYAQYNATWGAGWGLTISGIVLLVASATFFVLDYVGKLFSRHPVSDVNTVPLLPPGDDDLAAILAPISL
jgi:tetratricopeptide (TPR) repeat protein